MNVLAEIDALIIEGEAWESREREALLAAGESEATLRSLADTIVAEFHRSRTREEHDAFRAVMSSADAPHTTAPSYGGGLRDNAPAPGSATPDSDLPIVGMFASGTSENRRQVEAASGPIGGLRVRNATVALSASELGRADTGQVADARETAVAQAESAVALLGLPLLIRRLGPKSLVAPGSDAFTALDTNVCALQSLTVTYLQRIASVRRHLFLAVPHISPMITSYVAFSVDLQRRARCLHVRPLEQTECLHERLANARLEQSVPGYTVLILWHGDTAGMAHTSALSYGVMLAGDHHQDESIWVDMASTRSHVAVPLGQRCAVCSAPASCFALTVDFGMHLITQPGAKTPKQVALCQSCAYVFNINSSPKAERKSASGIVGLSCENNGDAPFGNMVTTQRPERPLAPVSPASLGQRYEWHALRGERPARRSVQPAIAADGLLAACPALPGTCGADGRS